MQMQECELFSFLLTAASLTDTRDWSSFNLILLDIFHLSFRLARPEELAKDLRAVRNDQLSDLLSAESRLKRADSRKGASRHNRFGTTVSLNNVRVVSTSFATCADPRLTKSYDRAIVDMLCTNKRPSSSRPPKSWTASRKASARKLGRMYIHSTSSVRILLQDKLTRMSCVAQDELAPPLGLTTDALRSLRVVALGFLEGAGNSQSSCTVLSLVIKGADILASPRLLLLGSPRLEEGPSQGTRQHPVLFPRLFLFGVLLAPSRK